MSILIAILVVATILATIAWRLSLAARRARDLAPLRKSVRTARQEAEDAEAALCRLDTRISMTMQDARFENSAALAVEHARRARLVKSTEAALDKASEAYDRAAAGISS